MITHRPVEDIVLRKITKTNVRIERIQDLEEVKDKQLQKYLAGNLFCESVRNGWEKQLQLKIARIAGPEALAVLFPAAKEFALIDR